MTKTGADTTAEQIATGISGIFLLLLMVFPQLPIQFRYLCVIAAIVFTLRLSIYKGPGVKLLFFYIFYISVVGLLVVALTGGGDYAYALTPLRTLAIGIFSVAFVLGAGMQGVVLFNTSVLGFGCLGIVLDYVHGPASRLIPFPIFPADYMSMIEGKMMVSDRLGGFTFEAGVIGGMSAIFILINFSILYLGLCNKRLAVSGLFRIIAVAGIAFGFAAIGLSQTKSGLFILALAYVAGAVTMLFVKRSGPTWIKTSTWIMIVVMFFTLPIAYGLLRNTSIGEYLRKEIDNGYTLVTRGFDRDEGQGLKTRIEQMKVAIYGLAYHPYGGGYSNDGFFYAAPVLDYIVITPEMQWFYKQRIYNGFKGAIFNMLGYGGLVSIVVLILLYRKIWVYFAKQGIEGGGVIAVVLVVGLTILGVSVELLPFVEIVMLVICVAWLVANEANAIQAGNGPRPGTGPRFMPARPVRTQVKRPL